MQNKNNKTKKKNLKTLNNGDIGYEKRVKT